MKQLSKLVAYIQIFIGFSLEKEQSLFHFKLIPSYNRYNDNLLVLKYLHAIYEWYINFFC